MADAFQIIAARICLQLANQIVAHLISPELGTGGTQVWQKQYIA